MRDLPGLRFAILLAAAIVFIIGAVLCPGPAEFENSAFIILVGLALFSLAHLAPWE